jgi:hypothetical protein
MADDTAKTDDTARTDDTAQADDTAQTDDTAQPGNTAVRHAAAKAVLRDLNRNLTDLLGPCPSTVDGAWVVLRPGAAGTWVAGLPDLSVADALRISTVIASLDDVRSAPAPIPSSSPSVAHVFDTYFEIGSSVPVSRVHVEVPR